MAQGHTISEAAASVGISEATAKRARRRLRNYGDIEGGVKRSGRKSKLTPSMKDVILLFFRLC